MRVVVVAVHLSAVAYIAFQAMDSQVQAAQAAGFVGFFDAVNGKFRAGILFVLGYEPSGLDEHAT